MGDLQAEFNFDFDACPYPKPDDFDGLTCEWGKRTYANIPFGSIIHQGKKKGPTAWMRKAIAESEKGKTVVVVYPVDKWILMMLKAGAEVRNLGDVRWCATEDGSEGKGTGRHIAAFVLRGQVDPNYAENRLNLSQLVRAQLHKPGSSEPVTRTAAATGSAAYGYNSKHAVGTCADCGADMAFNVPRLGWRGGCIHKETGSLECAKPNNEISDGPPAARESAAGDQGPFAASPG